MICARRLSERTFAAKFFPDVLHHAPVCNFARVQTIDDSKTGAETRHLTPEQLARRQNCGVETIRRKLRAGEIRALKVGKLWRVPLSFVEEYERAALVPTEQRGGVS